MLKSKIIAAFFGLALIATPMAQAGKSGAGSIVLGTTILVGTGFVVWKWLNNSLEVKLDAFRKEVQEEFQSVKLQLAALNAELLQLKEIAEGLGIQIETVQHTTNAHEALQIEIAKAVKVSSEKINTIIQSKQDAINALKQRIAEKKDVLNSMLNQETKEKRENADNNQQASSIIQIAARKLFTILKCLY